MTQAADNISKTVHRPEADKYAARVLMLSFFLPMQMQVWSVMAVGIYFVLRVWKEGGFGAARHYLPVLLLGAPFLLYLVAAPFTPPEFASRAWHLCEYRMGLLAMPLIFAIAMPLFGEVLLGELVWFVYGSLVISFYGNMAFVSHYLSGTGGEMSHVVYRTIFHHITGIHPTYMSMFLCFSTCILLLTDALKKVWVKNLLLYLLLIFLLALGAKTPLLALFVIFIHFIISHRKTIYTYTILFAGLIATAIAAWAFIPFISQRVNEMLLYFRSGTQAGDNSVYVRKVIWDMDVSLLKQHWLTGVGPGRLISVLQQHYQAHAASNSLQESYYDPHNEYIYVWLCFGLAGIVVFVTVLASHFLKAIRGKDHLYLYLLIIVCATFFTESVLSTQHGVIFFSVFTSMLYFRRRAGALPV